MSGRRSLGQATHRAGYRLEVLAEPARTTHAHDDLRSLWRQLERWLVTIRRYYPAFPLLVLATALPLSWALLYLAVSWRQPRQWRSGVGVVALVAVAQVAPA